MPPGLWWINAVEGCFVKLARRKLKRGVFHGVIALQAAIKYFVVQHDRYSKPLVWRADPKDIIAAVKCGHPVLEPIR